MDISQRKSFRVHSGERFTDTVPVLNQDGTPFDFTSGGTWELEGWVLDLAGEKLFDLETSELYFEDGAGGADGVVRWGITQAQAERDELVDRRVEYVVRATNGTAPFIVVAGWMSFRRVTGV